MNTKLELLKLSLLQLVDAIDSGNSNMSEYQQNEALGFMQRLLSPDLTKLESADYIGVCRATFDNYVKKGLIPEGEHRRGSNELRWKKCDLDNYLNNKNNK